MVCSVPSFIWIWYSTLGLEDNFSICERLNDLESVPVKALRELSQSSPNHTLFPAGPAKTGCKKPNQFEILWFFRKSPWIFGKSFRKRDSYCFILLQSPKKTVQDVYLSLTPTPSDSEVTADGETERCPSRLPYAKLPRNRIENPVPKLPARLSAGLKGVVINKTPSTSSEFKWHLKTIVSKTRGPHPKVVFLLVKLSAPKLLRDWQCCHCRCCSI